MLENPQDYTDEARRVIERAEEIARELNHWYVSTGHLLASMAVKDKGSGPGNLAYQTLRQYDLDDAVVMRALLEFVDPLRDNPPHEQLYVTKALRTALGCAGEEAYERVCQKVGAEHLLIGLLCSMIYDIMNDDGVEFHRTHASEMLCDRMGVETALDVFSELYPAVIKLMADM